jgi:hypothetical protein
MDHDSLCTSGVTQINLYLLGHDSICASWVPKIQFVPIVSIQFSLYQYQSGQDSVYTSWVTRIQSAPVESLRFNLYQMVPYNSVRTSNSRVRIQSIQAGSLGFNLHQLSHYDSICTNWFPTIQSVPVTVGSSIRFTFVLSFKHFNTAVLTSYKTQLPLHIERPQKSSSPVDGPGSTFTNTLLHTKCM